MKQHILRMFFLLSFCLFFFFAGTIFSEDEINVLGKQIDDLTRSLNMSINATKPLESELTRLQAQIKDIKQRVANIESDIITKRKNIEEGYASLEKQQEVLNRAIRDFYVKSYYDSPFLVLFSASSASEITQLLTYQKKATEQDKAIITNIALSISDLETKKKNLEDEEIRITAFKKDLDEQSGKLDKIVTGAKQYQASLNSQIAQLSAKQQQLLAEKLGSLNIPLFAYSTQGGCSSDIDPYKDPGFSGTKFGLFTYGVPNRVGLNQYGAFGRAKAKQGYEEILRAYYNFDSIEKRDATITVEGYHGYSLDDYTKRIYEVPNEWGDQGGQEALKAQAIAARSYALAYTNNGAGSICTTQQCQVFQDQVKTGNWEQAVNDTSGMVMVKGGNPIKAWFSSTHGGYIFNSGSIGWSGTDWTKNAKDTTGDISSFSDLQSKAYDRESPWFYCDWGGRKDYNKTAWLTSAELADIVNSILLVQADNSADSHILQTDKGYGDAWSEDKVKQELGSHRTAFTSISDGHVDADFNNGKTTRVYFSGDAGSVDFPADVFKKYFNLRAPSNINIVGPLYNVEKR